jgi:stalled ribosome rescue protein Dom34
MKNRKGKNLSGKEKSLKQNEDSKYLKIIAKKLNSDKQYREKILKNYSFAKKELHKAGLEISPKFHRQIRAGYKLLNDATAKVAPSATLFIKIQRSLFKVR